MTYTSRENQILFSQSYLEKADCFLSGRQRVDYEAEKLMMMNILTNMMMIMMTMMMMMMKMMMNMKMTILLPKIVSPPEWSRLAFGLLAAPALALVEAQVSENDFDQEDYNDDHDDYVDDHDDYGERLGVMEVF